jgi:hypothetical protein
MDRSTFTKEKKQTFFLRVKKKKKKANINYVGSYPWMERGNCKENNNVAESRLKSGANHLEKKSGANWKRKTC